MESSKNMRKMKGVVVSNKMQSTLVVAVTRLRKHPKYGKYYKSTRKFRAHYSEGHYRIGDVVIIGETRPISKTKRWVVVRKAVSAGDNKGEQ